MYIPPIIFESVNDFIDYCKLKNILPYIQINAKKHQNMKNEYLHDIYGYFDINHNIKIKFKIEEKIAFKEKIYPTDNGYKLSDIKR